MPFSFSPVWVNTPFRCFQTACPCGSGRLKRNGLAVNVLADGVFNAW
ncbi:hypothetical protein HMPREF9123_0830 [Neisseria bacilliformis ATCC BAA-1200]|uniref:Uncharacterized protein n=1 Tax=Neisseria bacilliformis ATCC BAA-1200 TaxID=888742 RepID=F2BAS6_9NEIS|nr:hypothetical protein HMPREF9123_0830 [Neisseria bacilliformis ATCC BAA-1200]